MSWKKIGGLNYNESKRGVSDYEGNLYNKLVVNDLSVNNVINIDESVGINYPATQLDLSIPKHKQLLLAVGGNYKQTGSILEIFNQDSTNNNNTTQKHALVHTDDDILQINPNQDYEKSIHIYSSVGYPTKILGNLDISANNVNIYGITESSRSLEYYTFPDDGQDTDFVLASFNVSNNFSNFIIDGSLNITNNIYLQDVDISASSLAELYKNADIRINNVTHQNLNIATMTNEINSSNKEAMAHNELDRLVINGKKDYTGGVHIKGGKYNHNIFLDGNVQIGYCSQTAASQIEYQDDEGNTFTEINYGEQTNNESYNKAFTTGSFPDDISWVENTNTNNFTGGYKVDIAGNCRIRGNLLYLEGNLIVEGSKVVLNDDVQWQTIEHILVPKTLLVGYPKDMVSGNTNNTYSGPESNIASTDIKGSIVNRNDLFLGDPYTRENYTFNDYESTTDHGRVYGSIYFANSNNNSLSSMSTDSQRTITGLASSDFKYTGIVKRQLSYGANYGSELLLYNYKYPQNFGLNDNSGSQYYNSGDRIRLFGGAIRFDTYNTELNPMDVSNNHFNDDMYTRMVISGNGNIGIGDKFKTISLNNEPNVKLEIDSTDAIRLPVGNVSERPIAEDETNQTEIDKYIGSIRFNSDSNKFEGYIGTPSRWESLNGVTNTARTAYITTEENTDQIDFYAPDDIGGQGTQKMRINKDGVEIFGSFINSGSIDMGNELGIGIVEPASILHLKGNTPVVIIEDTNSSETKGGVCFTDNEKAWSMIRGTGTTSDGGGLQFYTLNSSTGSGTNYPFNDPISDTDLIERMCITNEGNVGIGTDNPGYKLHVNTSTTYDGIYLYHGSNTLGKIAKNDNNSGYLQLRENDSTKIRLNSKANEKSFINNGGNLGIGTENPGHKLHVNTSTTYDGIYLYNGNNRLGKIAKNDNNSGYLQLHENDSTKIRLNSKANQKSFINNGGNLGIGTDNPSEKLHVEGNIKCSGNIVADGSFALNNFLGIGISSPEVPLHVKYENHTGQNQKIGFILENGGTESGTTDYEASMMFKAKNEGECKIFFNHTNDTYSNYNQWSIHSESSDTSGNLFVIDYNPDVQDFTDATISEKYCKFGFNTINPLNSYHFCGAGGTTYNEGSISISSLITGGERIASIVLGSHLSENNLDYSSKIASYNDPSDTDNRYNSDLRFYTCNGSGSTNEKMRIDHNGNVGIGTSSPSEKLEVDGKVKATEFEGNGVTPIGGIIMWSGDLNNDGTVPSYSNWHICDGTSNTPDLRGRFIMGSTNENQVNVASEGQVNYQTGQTGGQQRVQLEVQEMPSHTHNWHFETNHIGEESDSPYHAVLAGGNDGNQTSTINGNQQAINNNTYIAPTGNNGAHENRPPYYVLAYIMRIS